MTEKPLRLLERASRYAVWAAGLALIAVAFLVTVEVVLRRVFLVGLSMASEISGYVLAVGTAFAYAFALFQRNHVRVDAIVRLFPRRVVVWIDLLAVLALTGFAALLVWHGWGVFEASWARGSRAMTPLGTRMWIPQILWLAGLTVFLVTCVVVFVHASRLVLAGRHGEASELIGTFSREDELAEAEQAAEQAISGTADADPPRP
jgi:TRAP-type C4-dicarboxylate transport system permease small subunit